MNLQHRLDLLVRLGDYILSDDEKWLEARERSSLENSWFLPEFVELATKNIAETFLKKENLETWIAREMPEAEMNKDKTNPKSVGLVMAGNIPLVGFHDWLCVFISGHIARIKPSSKDQVLIKHLVAKMTEWDKEMNTLAGFEEILRGCDAYIATGSNNSSRYFEYYFRKYPHIIRRNRTSVAILSGDESTDDLDKLADDVYLFFGLGCRNVTKIYVPPGYDFIPLLEIFKKYNRLADYHKYKNNYDYNLAIHLLNKTQYMSDGSLLLVKEPSFFSPIGQLNYDFYVKKSELVCSLKGSSDLQAIIGSDFIPFGMAQSPSLTDYADGVNTMQFLATL
jgi:Acyl-CoA reductase (LuxC)